jgi:signal transduction histidine kinase
MRVKPTSLKSHLLLLALFSGAAAVVVGLVAGWIALQGGRERISASLLATSQAIMISVENALDEANALGRGLSGSNALLASGDIAAFELRARTVTARYGYSLMLRTADDERVTATKLVEAPPGPLVYDPANPILRLREAPPQVERTMVNGQITLFVVQTIEDRAGVARYIFGVGVPTATFQSILSRQRLPSEWSSVVLDADWIIVARGRSPGQFVGKMGAGQELRHLPDDKTHEVRVLEGDRSITAHSRSKRYGWTSAIAVSTRDIFQQIAGPVALSALSGFAVAALAIGAVWIFAARLAGGIAILADATGAIGKDKRLTLPPFRLRELERVAEGLQRAATNTAENRRELERRIAEATDSLNREMEERRKVEAGLAQTQRLESLGRLSSVIAHDFNNLLMIMSTSLPRLKEAIVGSARGRQAAETMERAIQRGTSLTRQLLGFARRQPLNPVAVQIGQRFDGLRDFLASSIGPSVDLRIDIPPGLPPVKIDANEFELAVLNLVVNARDAFDEAGTIRIHARKVHFDDQQGPAGLAGHFVAVSVSDSGRGIAPEILSKVFDPFFTTKDVGKGTGLGLFQVYGFAAQSGGAVTIDSTPGKGTTVTLHLPVAEVQRVPGYEMPLEA